MTSTDIVRGEIRRFIRSSEPEVICVTGDWGVGKTYIWQTELDAAKTTKHVGLTRYSYASVFGINSLDALKLALFENLVFLDAPADGYKDTTVNFIKRLTSNAARYSQLAQGLPAIGQFLSKAGPLYFSAVRNQMICIDDLERRGAGLELVDVFGLISFLREQRACKVILLLNATQLENDSANFNIYFEKVIDARLVFSPTSVEALDIALKSDDQVGALLRGYCESLNISNIRVIKKVERLVRQTVPHLKQFAQEVTKQAVHSLTLFGWSKFQPHLAPPLDYYRVSSTARYFARRRQGEQASPEDEKWSALLNQYQFTNMDDFDAELAKFVDTGVLDIPQLRIRAEEQNRQLAMQKMSGTLEKAWRPFHDSFRDNLDEVTGSIVSGLKANVEIVSLSNLDAAITLLHELGKPNEATDVLHYFVEKRAVGFWDRSSDPFLREHLHPAVADAMAAQQSVAAAATDAAFDPESELIRASETYNNEVIKRLAEVPVDEYYLMIKSKDGDEMRKIILSGLEFRRISNATPEMLEVVRRVEEALKRIGSESTLNAVRVGRYGIKLPGKA